MRLGRLDLVGYETARLLVRVDGGEAFAIRNK